MAEVIGLQLVQVGKRVDGELAGVSAHPFRVGHIENRVAFAAALHPLIDAGQKAAAPAIPKPPAFVGGVLGVDRFVSAC